MAWTSPITWVANTTALTAATLNTHLRDNLNYLKGLLDGTGSDNVTVPLDLAIRNDSLHKFSKNGSNPIWYVDTLDSLQYDRATNAWWFAVGGSVVLTVDSTGKVTPGTGAQYESAITAVSAGATQGFTHGLGVQPRYVEVWFGAGGAGQQTNIATPAFLSVGATVRWSAADSTTISVTNNHGSAWSVRVLAWK